MADVTITLSLDAAPVERFCADLLAELAQRPPQTVQAAVDRFHALGESAWTTRVDLDLGAAAAPNHRVALEPSEPLLALLAALRAGDLDLGVVQEASHGRSLLW